MTIDISVADILRVIAISAFAGGTSFIGALISKYVNFSQQQMLFLISFGAGILMSAAIFEMVIDAEEQIGISLTLLFFVIGSVVFTVLDVIAEKRGGGAGILLGISLDSIPESLAIGASVATGSGFVIAILIGIQNIPEGIASFQEMTSGRNTAYSGSPKKALCNWNSICNSCCCRSCRFILFAGNAIYYCNSTGAGCRGDILYVILRYDSKGP